MIKTWKGMDLNYVSKDVANRFFGDIINMSREDLVKQIMESTVLDFYSKEDADKIKYESVTMFLDMKKKLEEAQ
jgi:hypothetical protein